MNSLWGVLKASKIKIDVVDVTRLYNHCFLFYLRQPLPLKVEAGKTLDSVGEVFGMISDGHVRLCSKGVYLELNKAEVVEASAY